MNSGEMKSIVNAVCRMVKFVPDVPQSKSLDGSSGKDVQSSDVLRFGRKKAVVDESGILLRVSCPC